MTKFKNLILSIALAGVVGCGADGTEYPGAHSGFDEKFGANLSTGDASGVNLSATDADKNGQIQNTDQVALSPTLRRKSSGQEAGLVYENLPAGWSPWLSPNPDGTATTLTYTFYGTIIGIQGYEEPYYGLVNLRLQAQDSYGAYYMRWTTSNFRGDYRTAGIGPNDRTIGVEVKEQHYYGLIDARLMTYRDSGWYLTGNPDANEYHSAYCAPGYELGGIQVKEQSGYGIVNLRIYCKPI